MALPSSTSLERSPILQISILLSRQVVWSLFLEVLCGFCKRTSGRTIVAFKAIDSRVDDIPKARYSLASSLTNSFPALF